MYRISKLFNPEIFQGKSKNQNYFEGWYYKIVDKDEKTPLHLFLELPMTKIKMDMHLFR